MKIKKFLNGNFNVRREPEYKDDTNLIVALCNSAELDFFVPEGDEGEPYCLGNAIGMAQDLYNAHTNRTYTITDQDQETWAAGFSVKLIAKEVNTNEN